MEESRPSYILDASVILKWFFEEAQGQAKALALQKAFLDGIVELGIPDYCYAEILNTMGRELSAPKAVSGFSLLRGLLLKEFSITVEIANIAFRLMKNYEKISFYDAGYHALAIEKSAVFITADEKYYKKTKKEKNIMMLSEY